MLFRNGMVGIWRAACVGFIYLWISSYLEVSRADLQASYIAIRLVVMIMIM